MEAWTKTRFLGTFLLPAATAATAAVVLLTVLLSWISVCGTWALATAAWCLAAGAGAATAPWLRRVIHHPQLRVAGASLLAVAAATFAGYGYQIGLSLAAGSGLPAGLVWLAASVPEPLSVRAKAPIG